MLRFERESTELINIYEMCTDDQALAVGDFALLDGHWYCTIKIAVNQQAFEQILNRMQLLHSFEPPYYKGGNIIVTTGTGSVRRAEFPVGHFVRVDEIEADNTRIVIIQSLGNGVNQICSLDSKEDILGAVKYGQKRISTKSTHADPG